MAREFADFFGTPLREGQRVLHVSRNSTVVTMELKKVIKVTPAGVTIQAYPNEWTKKPKPVRVIYPDRLVVHPEDINKERSK